MTLAGVLQKWYTRAIGIFFLLVFLSLVVDYREFGHRAETWHKIFRLSCHFSGSSRG